ncbi:hypothetical protein SDC9_07704 [bioreactor metagenome]|uniref:DUF1232 domain-containing protein n=1 Tax=bioreactor metagenome TaxID=1076179 RepID=A0A644T593_9ZZZZ|nr:YkvA family protein [Methanobrevibacter sp.]MEA4956569.1 YkvA family protein [Methanobrevibacter sp.]
MISEFKDFYIALQENLDSYNGEYAPFIDYGPELFKLLCDILDDKRISADLRLKISAGISYYVVPMDVIPETIYGPYGYIDDIYLTVYVLKEVTKIHGYELLEQFWHSGEKISDVMDICFEKSKEVLEESQINDILNYVGLRE